MTITLSAEQERILEQAIKSGTVKSVDEFIDAAIARLSRQSHAGRDASRREAVRRMMEFGEKHRLSLGEPITRKLLHEGRRY